MKKVYYHIQRNTYDCHSVGVICVEDGVIPYDTIKKSYRRGLRRRDSTKRGSS